MMQIISASHKELFSQHYNSVLVTIWNLLSQKKKHTELYF